MAFLSDLDHYRIDARLSGDGKQVLQYESVTDVTLGLKDHKIKKTWLRERTLSQGHYSKVWLEEQENDPNSKRAVKTIEKSRMVEIQIDHTRELKALHEFSKAKHRQKGAFVDFLGWWEENDIVSFAMEYFPLGDLEANMKTVLEESAIREITEQLLQGLDIMHGMKFAHRDLKPANVFVVRRAPLWWVKIGDFGMSKQIESGAALQTYVGTYNYMAPEFFGYVDNADEERFEYTRAIDLWALGCIVYRLCTQMVPFPFHNNSLPLKHYCEQTTLFPEQALLSRGISKQFVALVKSLLRPEPSERLPAGAGLALLESFTDYVPEVGRSDFPLPESQRMDTVALNELETSFTSMQLTPSETVVSKPAGQQFHPQRAPAEYELDFGTEKRPHRASSTTGFQVDSPSASTSLPRGSDIASPGTLKRVMTWQQGGGDERRSTSPQAQERQDNQEYLRERRHKPSRSSSHTLVEASSIAAEPDSLRSQSPSTSQISPNLGLGNRATSAPDSTPTRKTFLEKLRRTISGDSASTRERDKPRSTHSVYDNPFAGAFAPRSPRQLRKLEDVNAIDYASDSTQRDRASKVLPATPRKIVKSQLASPSDTLVPEEEDGTPCTHRRDSDTSDVLYSSRRFSGQSFKESPGSRAAAKLGTGPGIKIRTTELSNVDEQTEELLTGVQWDTRALSDYCDQLFNPIS